MNEQERLEEYLGKEVSSTNYTFYKGEVFETEGGEEYAVFSSYDDAYDSAVEWNLELIQEGSLPNLDIENFIDDSFIAQVADEEYEYYKNEYLDEGMSEDEAEEEAESIKENIESDFVGYMRGIYSEKEFKDFLIEHNALDERAMAEECVDIDGIAHALASYDGNEIDLGDDFYAYRIN